MQHALTYFGHAFISRMSSFSPEASGRKFAFGFTTLADDTATPMLSDSALTPDRYCSAHTDGVETVE